jgi:hypothetical protein
MRNKILLAIAKTLAQLALKAFHASEPARPRSHKSVQHQENQIKSATKGLATKRPVE